jgi:hypothetical protein
VTSALKRRTLPIETTTRAGLVDPRLGGFSVLFADGTEQFLKQDLTASTLRAFFTRAGADAVEVDR